MSKPAKATNGLDVKQARFVEEYLVDLNAKHAAIRAGYTEATAHGHSHEFLKEPVIVAAIAAAVEKRSKRTGITSDRVLEELAAIGLTSIADFLRWEVDEANPGLPPVPRIDISLATRMQLAAVSEMTCDAEGRVKFKLHNKLEALDKIGRHLGMWNDKLRLGEDPEAPFSRNVEDPAVAARIASIFENAQRRFAKADAGDKP